MLPGSIGIHAVPSQASLRRSFEPLVRGETKQLEREHGCARS